MNLLYLSFALLLMGCQDRSAPGTVVDGMTELPVAGLRLVARAQEQADLTCQVLETTTEPDGTYQIKNACRDIPYLLESGDKTLFLAGNPSFVGGKPPAEPMTINAWRAPPGSGVYVLKGAEIFAMRLASKIATLPLWKSTEKVRYPETVPAKLPVLRAADYLILSGAKHIKRLVLEPLIKHDSSLRFGSRNHFFDMDAWSYIGRSFTSKEDHVAVAAKLDETQVINLIEDKRALQYIPGSALPNGIYALSGQGDQRVYLLEIKQ